MLLDACFCRFLSSGYLKVSNDVVVKCLIKYFKIRLMLFVVFIVNNRGGNNS